MNFNIKLTSEKEHLTSLEFKSKSISSVLGNSEIQVKTTCHTNSNGEDVINVYKVSDGKETPIANFIYNYGKDL